jgi:hypothetical protein
LLKGNTQSVYFSQAQPQKERWRSGRWSAKRRLDMRRMGVYSCCIYWEGNMMQLQNASTSMRLLFLTIAALIWVGIWLSGYNSVHWILYLPAAFLTFAAATGICPGLHILGKIFGKS